MEVRFDGHCFGCGPLNMDGLRLVFTPGPDGSVAEYGVPDRFQSWAGMAHGGAVALMLAEAVGWAAWDAGHPGGTGRRQAGSRRPLKPGAAGRIEVEGRSRAVAKVPGQVSRDWCFGHWGPRPSTASRPGRRI